MLPITQLTRVYAAPLRVAMYSQQAQTRSGTTAKSGYTLISLFFRYSTLGANRLNCCHKAECMCMCIRVVYVKFYSCCPKVAEENRIRPSRQHFKCPIVWFCDWVVVLHQIRWLAIQKYWVEWKVEIMHTKHSFSYSLLACKHMFHKADNCTRSVSPKLEAAPRSFPYLIIESPRSPSGWGYPEACSWPRILDTVLTMLSLALTVGFGWR